VAALNGLQLRESASRFELLDQSLPGASQKGISEDFPTSAPRSLYGGTKLAAEILIEEYCHAYSLQAVINRCGVVAGPWQMGKADQGIFTFWLASHTFKRALRYIGFGGRKANPRLLHAAVWRTLSVSSSPTGKLGWGNTQRGRRARNKSVLAQRPNFAVAHPEPG
jgi:CDP-paratose 2-epimerase